MIAKTLYMHTATERGKHEQAEQVGATGAPSHVRDGALELARIRNDQSPNSAASALGDDPSAGYGRG